MINFWKTHKSLRYLIIIIFIFVCFIVLPLFLSVFCTIDYSSYFSLLFQGNLLFCVFLFILIKKYLIRDIDNAPKDSWIDHVGRLIGGITLIVLYLNFDGPFILDIPIALSNKTELITGTIYEVDNGRSGTQYFYLEDEYYEYDYAKYGLKDGDHVSMIILPHSHFVVTLKKIKS